ncbi:MAG TPA: DUF998 domain-containing protein [Acidimicrobiia bacterium]
MTTGTSLTASADSALVEGIPRWKAWAAVAMFTTSALALTCAPILMPESYSWLSHTTSESAAQGLSGAWLARLGFLLFGLGVLWVGNAIGDRWGTWGKLAHLGFGVLMLATAAFSHRPFEAGVEFDRFEDTLHSIAATAMGFAFAFGVVAVALRRQPPRWQVGDVIAVAASIVIPAGMAMSQYPGPLQRFMFLVAYVWYSIEVFRP